MSLPAPLPTATGTNPNFYVQNAAFFTGQPSQPHADSSWGSWFNQNFSAGASHATQTLASELIRGIVSFALQATVVFAMNSFSKKPLAIPNEENQALKIDILTPNCERFIQNHKISQTTLRLLSNAEQKNDPLYPSYLANIVKCVREAKEKTPTEES